MFFQIVASLLVASIAKLSQAQPWLDSLFAGLGTIILNEFIIWKHFFNFSQIQIQNQNLYNHSQNCFSIF